MPDISRRHFAHLVGGAAAATAIPLHAAPQNAVRLSSNENPYGPSPAALQAMLSSVATSRVRAVPRPHLQRFPFTPRD